MGLEYIVQPQVFLGGLTALGPGIQGLTEQYPLLTTYYSWTSTASVNTSAFPIPIAVGSIYNGPGKEASFIISVGGVIQSPTEYTVDPVLRTITFGSVVSAGIEFAATQLATAAPSSQSFDFIKSVSAEFLTLSAQNIISENIDYTGSNITVTNLLVTNLTALSSELRVVDITQYELSGFNVQGNATINGTISATGTMVIDTSSSNAALRVTQRGSTGNVIEVEDSANPDGTSFTVNNVGDVGIHTNSPQMSLDVRANDSNTLDGINISRKTNWVRVFPNLSPGSYNSLVRNGDGALIYTSGVSNSGSFVLAPWSFTGGGIRMLSSGFVGINTPDPTEALTVTGNVLVSGNITVTTPILSTDNSTQVATTNFVRRFGGYQGAVTYTSGTGIVNLSSLGEGIQKIKVTVVGGGGGGGGASNIAGSTGGGGGAGGALVKYINIVPGQTSYTYTVGAAGAAGGLATSGGAGEQSTFVYNSVTYTANGGGLGVAAGSGGAGGTATNGDINITGQSGAGGGTAAATNNLLGAGGSTGFGLGIGGPNPGSGVAPGIAATGFGGGGSGGHTNTTTATTGGAGAGGIVIVEW